MRLFAGTPFDRPPHCERCDRPESECQCPPLPAEAPARKPPGQQTARVAFERRKSGKTVTVIRGLAPADTDLPALLKTLKNHCGAGGTVDGEEVEIQGNQVERVREFLTRQGYRVR